MPRAPRTPAQKKAHAASERTRRAALDPGTKQQAGRKRRQNDEYAAVQRDFRAGWRARLRRDVIVVSNRDAVVDMAQHIHRNLPPQFDVQDLISIGELELIRAAATYAPKTHGAVPFRLYAQQAIRGKMLDSVRRNKYIEHTRESIDDPGPAGEDGDGRLTQAQRGLMRLATLPVCEETIDRDRLRRRVSAAVGLLPKIQRDLLRLWYSPAEPRTSQVARALGMTCRDARAMHQEAVGHLKAILLQSARPRAA